MLFCEKITTEKKLDPLGSIPKAHLLAFNNKVAKIRSSIEVEAGKTASSTKKKGRRPSLDTLGQNLAKKV